MKTLDEVIEKIEEFWVCPCVDEANEYCDLMEVREDVLNYLKEYRGLLKMWNDKLDKEQENQPLTWDELRTMEGKPVYVKLLGAYESYPNASRWMLVQSDVSFGNVWFIDRSGARYCFYEKDMNEIWQAYRKER